MLFLVSMICVLLASGFWILSRCGWRYAMGLLPFMLCAWLAFWLEITLFLLTFILLIFIIPTTFGSFAVVKTDRPFAPIASFFGFGFSLIMVCIVIRNGTQQKELFERKAKAYPFVSMTERLAYETFPDNGSESVFAERKSLSEFQEQVDEAMVLSKARARQLKRIHLMASKSFLETSGFGIGRMSSLEIITRQGNYEEDREFIPIDDYLQRAARMRIATLETVELPKTNDLENLHQEGSLDFVFPRGFGYIKDRDNVAGFIPHRLSMHPNLSGSNTWDVTRLELVSLLKHNEPRVYLSQHLPSMKELRSTTVPTRPLDDFEKTSLTNLRKGEYLVIDSTKERIEMFGAIRAVKQCLQCHQVKHGQLLGAFSYTLQPGK